MEDNFNRNVKGVKKKRDWQQGAQMGGSLGVQVRALGRGLRQYKERIEQKVGI